MRKTERTLDRRAEMVRQLSSSAQLSRASDGDHSQDEGSVLSLSVPSTVEKSKDVLSMEPSPLVPVSDSEGSLLGYRGVDKDITERQRVEEELQKVKDTLERQNTRLEALYHAGQMLNSTLEPDAILDSLTDEAMRVTRATHGQVLVVRPESGGFERRSLRGFSPKEAELARTVPLALDQGINGRAYTTRQAVRADDVQADPAYFPLIPTTRTELAVPIIRGGQVLGNLDLQSPEAGAFRDVDLDYLNALTDQVSIALENARLYQAEHEQRRLAETLRQVAGVLNASLDREQVLPLILEQLARVVDYDSASVMLLSTSGKTLDIVAQRGFSSENQKFVSLQVEALPHVQQVLQDRHPVIIADTSTDPRWWRRPESEYIRCWMGVPLVVHERVIGLLNVGEKQPGFYTHSDAELVVTFANQAAVAIENARLYQDQQRQLHDLALLHEISARVSASLDLQEVLKHIVQEAVEAVGTDAASINLLIAPGEARMMASVGLSETFKQRTDVRPAGTTMTVIGTGKPLLIPDVNQQPDLVKSMVFEEGIHSFIVLPLPGREQIIGAMFVFYRQVHQFSDGEVRLLTTLANQAAVAIENARLYEAVERELTERKQAEEALKKQAAQLALINDIGGKIAAVLDLDDVLDRAARLVQENFGYHHVSLFTLDHEQDALVMRTRAGDFAHLFPPDHQLKVGQGMVGWVGLHGKTLLTNDVDAEPRYVNRYPGVILTRSELSVPIRVGEKVIGVLDVQSPQPGAFDENDVVVMETLADQIAIAIENARLYEAVERELTERERTEEQLQRYAADLEQSNEDVKQFAYIVSHDLRAPLVNLKGFSAELRAALAVIGSATITALPHMDERQRQAVTTAIEEDIPEALGFIDSSVTSMDHFINAVLKLSRLGRRELKPEPIDVAALVQTILETLAHQIEERQVEVTVGRLPQVIADRILMEQIMGNILTNAVKYLTPDRAGEIEIAAERGRDETTFWVRDNGRGIAEDDMGKVFAPFRRAGRQDVPGEGMGLAYVQTLVRLHGGRIWCESELGVGTRFTFTISNHLVKGGDHV